MSKKRLRIPQLWLEANLGEDSFKVGLKATVWVLKRGTILELFGVNGCSPGSVDPYVWDTIEPDTLETQVLANLIEFLEQKREQASRDKALSLRLRALESLMNTLCKRGDISVAVTKCHKLESIDTQGFHSSLFVLYFRQNFRFGFKL